MGNYRKKPVVIQALQWNGTYTGAKAICDQLGFHFGGTYHPDHNTVSWWSIPTLEGALRAAEGDWIIKGVKGEVYPCKPDVFEQTYEAVP